MATYQVVAEAVHVQNANGMKLIYKGAFVPDDCDPDRLKHLVDTGMVQEVGSEADAALAPNAAIVPDENATTGGQRLAPDGTVKPPADGAGADAEAEQKRAAARAKLPADGSAPDGRASEAVWVEYAVSKGVDRAEAEKAGKDALKDMLTK